MSKKSSLNLDNAFLNAILYIAIGVLLCIFRTQALDWAMTAIGIALIVFGVLDVLKKHVAEGVVSAAVGVLVILGGWLFLHIILLVLGVVIAVKGVLDLLHVLEFKNWKEILSCAIVIAVGVLLIASKWVFLDFFFIVIGIIFIVDGALMLLNQK